MIAIHDLVKRYGSLVAVDHVTTTIETHESYGLLGPNGSGKTTLISCLLALLQPDNGRVVIDDVEMTPTAYAIKAKMGVVPQELAFLNNLTVSENIDFFCGLYVDNKNERKRLVNEAIAFTGLESHRTMQAHKLSGGLKRRLNIACGLAHKPEILILDEPTVAVDPQSRAHILDGVKAMTEQGVTVIYTTHYMEEAETLCDRVAIMDKGRILAVGSTDELIKSQGLGDRITIEWACDPVAASNAIRALDGVLDVTLTGNVAVVKTNGHGDLLSSLVPFLAEMNLPHHRLSSERPRLNDVFLDITGRELRDA